MATMLAAKGLVLKALIVAAVGAIVTVTALYLLRSRTVIYRFSESGDPSCEPGFFVFNPFRDQDPERCAGSLLESIKDGKCEESVSALPVDQNYRDYICQMEREHPLASWRLKNRTDQGDTVKMFYWHWENPSESNGSLWVTVERRDQKWQITGYQRHY